MYCGGMSNDTPQKAVFVGRFCPVHLGHEAVIRAMIERFGIENCFVVVGSSNHPVSMRHFFSYQERKGFLLHIFPGLKVFGLPDYGNDAEWIAALDDILAISGMDPQEVVFFGGCQEEVEFFYRFGRKVEIMNRFDGSTPKVSATEVRDALVQNRLLDGLIGPQLIEVVTELFKKKWEEFKKL